MAETVLVYRQNWTCPLSEFKSESILTSAVYVQLSPTQTSGWTCCDYSTESVDLVVDCGADDCGFFLGDLHKPLQFVPSLDLEPVRRLFGRIHRIHTMIPAPGLRV